MENTKQMNARLKWSRIKVLRLIEKNFASIGFGSDSVVNQKIFIGFLILGLSTICNFAYTVYEAKTFAEFNQSIFMGSASVSVALNLLVFQQNAAKLFAIMDGCDKIANKSDYRTFSWKHIE